MNSPQVVAQAMKNILPEYLYDFKVIEFAVYCSLMDDTNYKVFERVLEGKFPEDYPNMRFVREYGI